MTFHEMERRDRLRILIVEDDAIRESLLSSWLSSDIRPVVASSAGRAIGVLRLDSVSVYCGVILDHDLQQRVGTEMDAFLSGQDVANAIIQHLSRKAPVLIHSMNSSQSPVLVQLLRRAGFDVTQIPMGELSREKFCEWIEGVSASCQRRLTMADPVRCGGQCGFLRRELRRKVHD